MWRNLRRGSANALKENSGGRANAFEGVELEALHNEDSCQGQEELVQPMEVTQQAISQRHLWGFAGSTLQWFRNKKKWGDVWVKTEKCWTMFVVFKGKDGRVFCIVLCLGTKNGFITIPQVQKIMGISRASTTKSNVQGSKMMLCILWDRLDVLHY